MLYGKTDVLLRVQDCKNRIVNIFTSVLELLAGLADPVIVIAGQGGAARPPVSR